MSLPRVGGVGPVACESLLVVGGGKDPCLYSAGCLGLTPERAVPCPVVCFGVSIGLVWLWPACMLMCRVVLLFS